MKKYLIFISLFISTMLGAQSSQECGTTPTKAQVEYLNKTQKQRSAFSYRAYKSNAVIQIPVVNHIVTQSNGSGGLELQQLADAMDSLNNFYAQANIQFVECDTVRFINNSNWYHFYDIDEAALRSANDVQNAINIYYFETLNIVTDNGGSFEVCGYTSFPPGPDRVMMANRCAVNGMTLIHEIGHYFSLFHTHGDSNCGSLTDELVDGSNCEDAGDRLCDTPADPNLLGGSRCEIARVNYSTCEYIGIVTDANGEPYTPQVSNIMSYGGVCRSEFTQGQFDRVVFSILNDRNYLACFGTCFTTVTSFPYAESFETNLGGWRQGSDDDIDWIQHSDSTFSFDTGPINAALDSQYMYIESSYPNNPGKTANLRSPCFDISALNAPSLTFDYHLYGESMGTLALEISTDAGNTWTDLWSQTGNQGNTWHTADINLSSYISTNLALRFKGTTGNSYHSDMAIDNLNIRDNCPFPAGTPCNDNDACTINDVYDNTCNCTGTFQDTDGDGVCDADDLCPTDPDNSCNTMISYCTTQANSDYEFIQSVQIGDVSNTSGNDNGYGDYTANEPFNIGNFDTPVTLTPGFAINSYDENWKIWIDINKDGDFEDEGEEVFSGTSIGNNPLSGTINIPSADGQTTMRIAMIWDVAARPCSMIDYGEIEDYTVNLSTISNKPAVENNLVEVYPNPAENYINTDVHHIISGSNIQSVNTLIYGMDGQLIRTETLNATSVLTINIQHLPEAPYILRLQTDDGRTFTGKFFKL